LAGVSKNNALGRDHGFAHKTQGTLFFDVLRVLEYHRPQAFLLENVKNLRSHNKGDTFQTILKSLGELGYAISHKVIDAAGYVPQHRERIFIVGFKDSVGFDFENMPLAHPRDGPRLEKLLHDPSEPPESHYTIDPTAYGINAQSIVGSKYTLSDKLWSYLQRYAEKHKAAGNGFGYGLCTPKDRSRTLSARYHKDGSEILIHQENANPRRLTPRECARLMGYDSGRGRDFIIPVSDTRAYQQFGNSVVVPVVEAVAAHMKPFIRKTKQKKQVT
jgi:DNA (cytosine-5)-methyltransferase 1